MESEKQMISLIKRTIAEDKKEARRAAIAYFIIGLTFVVILSTGIILSFGLGFVYSTGVWTGAATMLDIFFTYYLAKGVYEESKSKRIG